MDVPETRGDGLASVELRLATARQTASLGEVTIAPITTRQQAVDFSTGEVDPEYWTGR